MMRTLRSSIILRWARVRGPGVCWDGILHLGVGGGQSVATPVGSHTGDIIARRLTRRNPAIEPERIKAILQAVQSGAQSVHEAFEDLKLLPYQDLGFAKIDHHRSLRKGVPEVVFGEGKTPSQIASIARELAERAGRFMVTRADFKAFEAVSREVGTRCTTRWAGSSGSTGERACN